MMQTIIDSINNIIPLTDGKYIEEFFIFSVDKDLKDDRLVLEVREIPSQDAPHHFEWSGIIETIGTLEELETSFCLKLIHERLNHGRN